MGIQSDTASLGTLLAGYRSARLESLMYYYLDTAVEITDLPNFKGFTPKPDSGWVNAKWPDGKIWTHWREQLKTK
jgi:hypothetical protein